MTLCVQPLKCHQLHVSSHCRTMHSAQIAAFPAHPPKRAARKPSAACPAGANVNSERDHRAESRVTTMQRWQTTFLQQNAARPASNGLAGSKTTALIGPHTGVPRHRGRAALQNLAGAEIKAVGPTVVASLAPGSRKPRPSGGEPQGVRTSHEAYASRLGPRIAASKGAKRRKARKVLTYEEQFRTPHSRHFVDYLKRIEGSLPPELRSSLRRGEFQGRRLQRPSSAKVLRRKPRSPGLRPGLQPKTSVPVSGQGKAAGDGARSWQRSGTTRRSRVRPRSARPAASAPTAAARKDGKRHARVDKASPERRRASSGSDPISVVRSQPFLAQPIFSERHGNDRAPVRQSRQGVDASRRVDVGSGSAEQPHGSIAKPPPRPTSHAGETRHDSGSTTPESDKFFRDVHEQLHRDASTHGGSDGGSSGDSDADSMDGRQLPVAASQLRSTRQEYTPTRARKGANRRPASAPSGRRRVTATASSDTQEDPQPAAGQAIVVKVPEIWADDGAAGILGPWSTAGGVAATPQASGATPTRLASLTPVAPCAALAQASCVGDGEYKPTSVFADADVQPCAVRPPLQGLLPVRKTKRVKRRAAKGKSRRRPRSAVAAKPRKRRPQDAAVLGRARLAGARDAPRSPDALQVTASTLELHGTTVELTAQRDTPRSRPQPATRLGTTTGPRRRTKSRPKSARPRVGAAAKAAGARKRSTVAAAPSRGARTAKRRPTTASTSAKRGNPRKAQRLDERRAQQGGAQTSGNHANANADAVTHANAVGEDSMTRPSLRAFISDDEGDDEEVVYV